MAAESHGLPEPKQRKTRPVVCFETGEIFSSAKEAALFAGVTYASIRSAIHQRCRAGGYHWYYQDEPKPAFSNMKSAKRPMRAVVCWETGEVFKSASTAASSVGVTRSSINDAIRKKSKSGGYHWYFADQPKPDSFDSKERKKRTARPVACWETGEVYENANAAAKAVAIGSNSISAAIRREGTAAGFHWYWADQPKPVAFVAPKRRGGKGRPKRAVVCWETGEVFASAKEAAETKGVKYSSNICAAIKNKVAAGGYHWYYQGEPKPEESEFKRPAASRVRTVACVETGEVYPSMQAAARAVGIPNASSIWKAVENGYVVGGYHWKDVSEQGKCD